MKQYIIVIILVVIAIVAIIVRVSNRPSSTDSMATTTPIVSGSSSNVTPTATTSPKPVTKPTVQTRPTQNYTRGGTYVDSTQVTASLPDGSIRVTTPAKNAVITSPVRIVGEAVGNWYFEGTFPAVITDASNVVIGQAVVPANGTWMTSKLVPFDFSMSFNQQVSGTRGHIILKKDNPSGLPQNDASLDIPIVFK